MKGIEIGDNVKFQTRVVLVCWGDNAKLVIGNNALICDGVIINAHESVNIGSNSMIAAYSYVVDNNHGMELGTPMIHQECTSCPIYIGDDVWIGTHCIVTSGVRIGIGSVLGAGAIAVDAIGEYMIAVGTPAREVKSRLKL
ncbi:acyltransferase [Clostridium estertheticum]|uniref:acyltransferase n=1 Tax=Clostridium estertheticum TaxID=238834 RepID=UPI001C7CD9CD|nr:acyltransferase [Clostridium estertheticum]MBX4270555.1 acyltransferase [Clostridium estertheticum]WLC80080.1 acyltransferase [Clostridium estertheticum]